MAPWLPDGDATEQLAGRKVLIIHGDRDRSEATPDLSFSYAARARQATSDVCRFEVAGADHYLLTRARDCWSLTGEFARATIGSRPMHPAIVQAMAESADLRTPLPIGFGSHLATAG